MKLGQTCFYKVSAACGGPSFKPNDTSKVEIDYVEFLNSDVVNASDVGRPLNSTIGHNDTLKRYSPPVTGMPRRFQTFKAEVGGNMVYKQAYDGSVANTTTTTVYTKGHSGRFDKNAATLARKVFGNPTLGDSQLAMRDSYSQAECSPRSLYIAVVATTDLATLEINVTAVAFTQ